MDYRTLLTVPLAALALSASGADTLRQPDGWASGASYRWPDGNTHEAGVAPESEASGQRALTVRSIGKGSISDIGGIGQFVQGYAGQRVRFTGQVKAAGVDGWGGLVVASGYKLLYLAHLDPDFDKTPPLGAAACPDWCEVSVVADIPADGPGAVSVGLALAGNGQVWARSVRLEKVGRDVPLSTQRFGVEAAVAARELHEKVQQMLRARQQDTAPMQPQNLSLQ
ncbi:hypothetical protein [Roseateles sp. P5_E7]